MSSAPDLVLFTARFPYDESEAVLAAELEVTAERFRRIFVIPSHPGAALCELPANVSVADPGWPGGWSRAAKLAALRSHPAWHTFRTTGRRLSNWRSYATNARAYLDILATNLLKAERLAAWIRASDLRDAIFYDYWFENSTLALAALRETRAIRCAVARAHGFDVYDSRWPDLGRVPFREYKARHLDAVFAVSENGASYLSSKLGEERGKVRLARLAIAPGQIASPVPAGPPVVVSCSALVPGKRVDRIPAALGRCGRPLHWIHFGDGPERARVESTAAALPPEVTWELRGQVANAAVRGHYERHAVSAFLSLSASEGIPIAMMEAQSCGIPIVSLAVGGVPEIVTDDTGLALDADAPADVFAAAVNEAVQPGRFDATRIRDAFRRRFDPATNYGRFADELVSLWESAR